jgi:hypothetical protein
LSGPRLQNRYCGKTVGGLAKNTFVLSALKSMNKREIGFTQGCGCAIHYVSIWDFSIAENLFKELNIPLSDYEEVCEEVDLEVVREIARRG